MSFNNIKYLLYMPIVLFLINNANSQSNSWNLLLDNHLPLSTGDFIIETDSGYVVLGIAFDTVPTFEQGITISIIDKKNASIIKSVYFDIEYGELDFDFLQKIKYQEGKLIFPMFNFSNKMLNIC